jgi:hypothetical protein
MAASVRLNDREDVRGAAPTVFTVAFRDRPRVAGTWRPDLGMQRDRLLVEADDGRLRRLRPLVQGQHVFHLRDVLPGELSHAPHFFRDGFKSWDRQSTRIVSCPARGTSRRFTASSAINRTVHRAAPAGGALHAVATMRCFSAGAKTSQAPGRGRSYSAVASPPRR